jgi:hypothetical protein
MIIEIPNDLMIRYVSGEISFETASRVAVERFYAQPPVQAKNPEKVK